MAVGGTKLDLELIDETYGKHADLYQDVLKVPTTASHDEIQSAYFDRRSELFTLLAKIDVAARSDTNGADQRRYKAEKKMDSVVFAVRILADPALRKAYNGIRQQRTGMSPTTLGYALKPSPSAQTANSSTDRSSSAGNSSDSSSRSSSKSKKQQQQQPPDLLASASSTSEPSKHWINSIFGGQDDEHGDEDRNPRKSRRRQKQQQQQQQAAVAVAAPREEPVPFEGEKEKRAFWGRKKRKNKKKKQQDPEGVRISLDDSLDTNATDTSMTDHEDELKARTTVPKSSSTMEVPSAAQRGQELLETATLEDDDTRRDDDTRTYGEGDTFASGSVYTNDLEDAAPRGGACGDDGMFGCLSGTRAFKTIANEVSGACEDTLVSVDQVFNAFTLTDKDIKAVKKKIDKAKRQLDR